MDKRILEAIRVQLFLVILITVSFIVAIWFGYSVFNDVNDDVSMIFAYVFFSFFLIFYLVSVFILLKRIFKIRKAKNVQPIKCIVRDFVTIAHHDKLDDIYPILEGYNDYKLYFTYGDHEFPLFTTSNGINIHRKDGSEVKIGDVVYIYIVKPLDYRIEIDYYKNVFYLDHLCHKFNHKNNTYDIQIMKELNCFEGIIDYEIRPE